MDKEVDGRPVKRLFSLKPVGCFWKAFFLDARSGFWKPPGSKWSTRVLARGWEMQGLSAGVTETTSVTPENRRGARTGSETWPEVAEVGRGA